jgi:hypothetical protein
MMRSPPARTDYLVRAGGLCITSGGFNRWSFGLNILIAITSGGLR